MVSVYTMQNPTVIGRVVPCAGSSRTALWLLCFLLVEGTLSASPAAAEVIRGGHPQCNTVAFTFDLCPTGVGTGGYDSPLIADLITRRIPATFFMSGRWMDKHDKEIRALLQVPFFEVGSHGQTHAHMPFLNADQQRDEITGPLITLATKYGRRSTLFRPPYGEYNDTTVEVVQQLGLRFVLWNAVSGDPDPHLSRKNMRDRLVATVRGGSLIVFHANGKGKYTRDVVDDLYDELVVKRGIKLVTVSELLQCQPTSR